MNKVTLKYELDLDFILFAISCPLRDYRLCYFLNKHTGLNLYKTTEHEAWLGASQMPSYFSRFAQVNERSGTEYYLISNKGCEGGFLVPEMRHSDYFLVVRNFIDDEDLEALQAGINAIPEVLVASEISPEKLKSKENLIF